MRKGIDISNLQGHPDTWPSQPWYQKYLEADFVIVQALEPPYGYPGHNFIDAETGKRGYTGVALRKIKADGKSAGVYPWLWNGLVDTRANILARLATVPPSVLLDMRPWIDTEDTSGGPQGLLASPGTRVVRQLLLEPHPNRTIGILMGITGSSRYSDFLTALAAADEWAAPLSLPQSGGYSGDWYISAYLNGQWPNDRKYWQANYTSDQPELLPMRPMVQYTSTPIDMDVMLESEIVTTPPTPPTPPIDCQPLKDGIEHAVNRLQIELAKRGALNKKIIAEIQSELFQLLQN